MVKIQVVNSIHLDNDEIVVATTRPETILGDSAIAVNPTDHRFSRFVGRYVIHPFDGRLLPVIADSVVDPTFGSGSNMTHLMLPFIILCI